MAAPAPGMVTGGYRDIVAHRIDAGCDENLLQPEIDPRCRADLASFNDIDIAASAIDVRSHDQEPVHPLRLCTQKLSASPARERRERRMRRTGDAINPCITQLGVSLVDRENELDRGVDALFRELAKLDRSDRRKVGVRNQI